MAGEGSGPAKPMSPLRWATTAQIQPLLPYAKAGPLLSELEVHYFEVNHPIKKSVGDELKFKTLYRPHYLDQTEHTCGLILAWGLKNSWPL